MVNESTESKQAEGIVLIVIIATAALLRFFRLGEWSFWLDEALTVSDSLHLFNSRSIGELVHARPLNFWITGWIFSFFTVSEWSARLVPAFVGIVTIPTVYYLSREFLGKKGGMLTAAFLSLSTWHIYWSQNARGYSLLLLFTVVSICLFYKGVEKGDRLTLLGSLLSFGLAYLSHPSALLILPAYCVYLMLIALSGFERPSGYKIRVLWVFFLPLVLPIIFSLSGIAELGIDVLNRQLGASPLYVLASVGYYVQPMFLVLGASGVVHLLCMRSRLGIFLGAVIIIPLITLLALSAITGASAVYLIHTLPAYYMAAAIVIKELLTPLHTKVGRIAIVVVLALLGHQVGMVFEYFTYQHGDRPRWGEATEYLTSVTKAGHIIASTNAPVVDYYLGSKGLELRKPEKVLWLGRRTLEKLQHSGNEMWLLFTQDWIERLQGSNGLKRWLEDSCKIQRIFEARTSAKNRSVLVYRCNT